MAVEMPDLQRAEELEDIARTRKLLEVQLAERTKHLLTRLVSDYRGDTFNPDKALGAIAEIAGMQEQIDQLTRRLRGA